MPWGALALSREKVDWGQWNKHAEHKHKLLLRAWLPIWKRKNWPWASHVLNINAPCTVICKRHQSFTAPLCVTEIHGEVCCYEDVWLIIVSGPNNCAVSGTSLTFWRLLLLGGSTGLFHSESCWMLNIQTHHIAGKLLIYELAQSSEEVLWAYLQLWCVSSKRDPCRSVTLVSRAEK